MNRVLVSRQAPNSFSAIGRIPGIPGIRFPKLTDGLRSLLPGAGERFSPPRPAARQPAAQTKRTRLPAHAQGRQRQTDKPLARPSLAFVVNLFRPETTFPPRTRSRRARSAGRRQRSRPRRQPARRQPSRRLRQPSRRPRASRHSRSRSRRSARRRPARSATSSTVRAVCRRQANESSGDLAREFRNDPYGRARFSPFYPNGLRSGGPKLLA